MSGLLGDRDPAIWPEENTDSSTTRTTGGENANVRTAAWDCLRGANPVLAQDRLGLVCEERKLPTRWVMPAETAIHDTRSVPCSEAVAARSGKGVGRNNAGLLVADFLWPVG